MKKRKAVPSRRDFLRKAGAGTAALAITVVFAPRPSVAAGHLPKVVPNDPTAKALEYTHASAKDGQ